MERPWDTDRINHGLHWDGYGDYHQVASSQSTPAGVAVGYHTYGLYWSPDEYIFYIDGNEMWRTSSGGVSKVRGFLFLSDEVGLWGGDIATVHDDLVAAPDRTLVDYVRVYD